MVSMMHVLPTEAYTSQEWFDQEQAHIFSRTWRFAGLMEDLAKPGDTLSVQAGLNNIFIVKGHDQRLRAFHNICRHRGTRLINSVEKSKKTITCPYHHWAYDLEGRLISVPNENKEFPHIDKSCFGLKPASVDIWRSMIFVHPDPDAGAIINWFGAVESHLGSHNIEGFVEYPDTASSYHINANWKIVVENYIDVYHLSHLHSNTLNMYDHNKAKFGFIGPHYAFWEPLSEDYFSDADKNTSPSLISSKAQAGASVPMLFPGIGLAESKYSWSTFIITPLSPDLTRVESRTRLKNANEWEFQKQGWRSGDYQKKKNTNKQKAEHTQTMNSMMTSGDFTAEDIYVCEQQQKSLKSPYFNIGGSVLSGENPVREHQQIILDYLKKRR